MGKSDTWTEERDVALVHLWKDGKSVNEIAEEIGCFSHCIDGGRSAVCGRVARHREHAKSEAERLFWTRGQRNTGSRKITVKKRCGTQVQTVRSHGNGSGARQEHELTRAQKIALIDAVPTPVIAKSTDQEVEDDFRRRMMRKNPEDDLVHVSWSSPRDFHFETETFKPRCTEPMRDGPCGADVECGTARCIKHGGRLISKIKITGSALEDPEPEKTYV